MTLSSKHRGFGQASRFALAVALAIPGAVALPGAAFAQEAQQDFNIAAGDLGAALQRYSAATGVQLVYSSDLVAGKRSPGVSGRMSPQQALGQLLAGSGLSARVSGNTATLVQAGSAGDVAAAEGERLLGPVRVEGSQGGGYSTPVRGDSVAQLGGIRGGQDEEAVGYRAKISSVSTGAPVAIEDVPRSVSVQTQEQIEKQGATTLIEALERAPGITIIPGGGFDATIRSRGFSIDTFQVDGGTARPITQSVDGAPINLDAFERVELVRGPNSLNAGPKSTGGSINLVRKRPGPVPAQSLLLEGGSFGRFGAVADVSTPELFGSAIAFRGVASVRRDGTPYDNYDTRAYLVSGLFDFSLGDNARLELGASYNVAESDGLYNGLPRFSDGPLMDVPDSFNIFDPSTWYRGTGREFFGNLYVDIADDWDLQIGAFQNSLTSDGVGEDIRYFVTSDGVIRSAQEDRVYQLTRNNKMFSNQLGINAKISGNFETFGIKHSVFGGMEFSQTTKRYTPGRVLALATQFNAVDDILNPAFEYFENPAFPPLLYSSDESMQSAFLFGDTISWKDKIQLTATFRYDQTRIGDAKVFQFDGVPFYFTYTREVGSGALRPSFSALIKPVDRVSIYASYADGFERNDSSYTVTSDGGFARLAPTTYKNKEIGVKYAAGKWLASLAVFDLTRNGVAVPDFSQPLICPPSGTSQCWEAFGASARSRGIDFEVNGEILDGLQVIASYNYNKTELGRAATDGGLSEPNLPPLVDEAPTSMASLFLDWRPKDQAFAVQIGARYKGRYRSTGTLYELDPEYGYPINQTDFEVKQKPYVVLDIGVDYDFSEALSARLFVENVTNERYATSSAVDLQNSLGNFFGRPRSFMASLKWKNVGFGDRRSPSNGRTPFGNPADWYFGAGAGIGFVGGIKGTASGEPKGSIAPVSWTFETEKAEVFDIRLGYHLTDNIRAEVQGQYRNARFGSIGGNDVAPFGVCGADQSLANGAPFDCQNVPGKTSSWSLMGNLLYDFGTREATFRPYVGAGAGLSRNTTSFVGKMQGIGSDDPWFVNIPDCCAFGDTYRQQLEGIIAQDTSTSLAWQLMAGVAFKLTPRLSIDAGYRYHNIPDMKWLSYNYSDAPDAIFPRIGAFSGRNDAHIVSLGVRWALGSR